MIRAALMAAVILALTAGIVHGAPKTSDTKVKASVNAGKQDQSGKQTIEVTLKIDDGWHLYANPSEGDFKENQVVVTANVDGKPVDAAIDYPKGKIVPAKDGLPAHSIYEGTITIKVTVDRSKLGAKPIDLNVKVYACDASTCLVGGDIKLNVP